MANGKKKDTEVPNLANATPGFLIDELGRIRDEIKPLTQREGFIKQAIMGRRKDFQNALTGEVYDGLITETETVRIVPDLVREHFKDDPETLATLTSTSQVVSIKTTKKTKG